MSGQVKLGQVRSGKVRSSQFWLEFYMTWAAGQLVAGVRFRSFEVIATCSSIIAFSEDILVPFSGGNLTNGEIVAGERARIPFFPRTDK